MTDVFEVVTASLSTVALFTNCVQCYEYVQLGRNFGQDYQTCQLQIDISMNRFTRWGEGFKIHERPLVLENEQQTQRVHRLLEQIHAEFEGAQKKSDVYKSVAVDTDLEMSADRNLDTHGQMVHARFREMAQRRHQGSTTLLQRASWALHDKKSLQAMLDNIKVLLDHLEKIAPVPTDLTKEMILEELQGIDNRLVLQLLQRNSDDLDEAMLKAVQAMLNATILIESRNEAGDIEARETSHFLLGSDYSSSFLESNRAFNDRSRNSAKRVRAYGSSNIHIGNKFGSSG